MKRMLALVLVVMLAATGCAPAHKGLAGKLNRDELLPDSTVSLFAGGEMKPVRDTLNESAGYVSWAWEEAGGDPKLLVVEIWTPPADVDGMYEQASQGAEALSAPQGSSACYDGRAVHIRCGAFYVRMALLGFQSEDDAVALLTSRLAGQLLSVK